MFSEEDLDYYFRYLLLIVKGNIGFKPKCKLVIDLKSPYPNKRDFAMTDGRTIYVSPKVLKCKLPNILALLMHEIAHVLYMSLNQSHTERETDLLAESVFGVKIYYDDNLVQTISGGTRPRPKELGWYESLY